MDYANLELPKDMGVLNMTIKSFFVVEPEYLLDDEMLPIFSTDISNAPTREEFKLKWDEYEKEYSLYRLRKHRDYLLKECDWVMVSDFNPPNKDEWVTYRQALRDLPKTQSGVTTDIAGNIIENVFPEKP
tara:strand:+ start:514 stop:903 length:390 start_codon:yes stop_codon:yes gene_type:complete